MGLSLGWEEIWTWHTSERGCCAADVDDDDVASLIKRNFSSSREDVGDDGDDGDDDCARNKNERAAPAFYDLARRPRE